MNFYCMSVSFTVVSAICFAVGTIRPLIRKQRQGLDYGLLAMGCFFGGLAMFLNPQPITGMRAFTIAAFGLFFLALTVVAFQESRNEYERAMSEELDRQMEERQKKINNPLNTSDAP